MDVAHVENVGRVGGMNPFSCVVYALERNCSKYLTNNFEIYGIKKNIQYF